MLGAPKKTPPFGRVFSPLINLLHPALITGAGVGGKGITREGYFFIRIASQVAYYTDIGAAAAFTVL